MRQVVSLPNPSNGSLPLRFLRYLLCNSIQKLLSKVEGKTPKPLIRNPKSPIRNQMTLTDRAKAVFAALTADDMVELGRHWAEDGIYNNPAFGTATLKNPAVGRAAVVETVGVVSKGLKERGEYLQVDRITQASEGTPRVYVEWHVVCENTESPRHGLTGLHVVEFNTEGFFHHVTVFAHPAK